VNDWIAVREQETVEVEVGQAAVRAAESRLRALQIVHEPIGNEGQRPVVNQLRIWTNIPAILEPSESSRPD